MVVYKNIWLILRTIDNTKETYKLVMKIYQNSIRINERLCTQKFSKQTNKSRIDIAIYSFIYERLFPYWYKEKQIVASNSSM